MFKIYLHSKLGKPISSNSPLLGIEQGTKQQFRRPYYFTFYKYTTSICKICCRTSLQEPKVTLPSLTPHKVAHPPCYYWLYEIKMHSVWAITSAITFRRRFIKTGKVNTEVQKDRNTTVREGARTNAQNMAITQTPALFPFKTVNKRNLLLDSQMKQSLQCSDTPYKDLKVLSNTSAQVLKWICSLLDYLTVGRRFSGDYQCSADKRRHNFHFNPETEASRVLRNNVTAHNNKLVISTSVNASKSLLNAWTCNIRKKLLWYFEPLHPTACRGTDLDILRSTKDPGPNRPVLWFVKEQGNFYLILKWFISDNGLKLQSLNFLLSFVSSMRL